jgi:hypothetical protein
LASGVLLFLFVHAFLVTATHGHRLGRVGLSESRAEFCVTDGEDLSHASELGGHSQCLLCRLQRNFAVDLQKTSQLVGPLTQKSRGCKLPTELAPVTRPFSVPAGRAPPLA